MSQNSEWHQAPHPSDVFWDNLGTKWFILGHIRINLNLEEGQITIQIVSFTQIAAKSLQLCLTLCDPIDGSPPGSPVLGIFQARTLEWVAISFSNAGK